MFFERPKSGERAILVHLNVSSDANREDPREFEELVLSAGGDPVHYIFGQLSSVNARFFVGTGKLAEILEQVRLYDAEIVLFNHNLRPSQERNLEKELECRVLDRTGLILDIFAQRARTHEGKLQVELAQLQHMSTRLVRGWTHLDREKGGIGMRGPGETQLESDRRMLKDKVKAIEERLAKVAKQREQGRRGRERAAIPAVSLVGYTNAGKSTLFNRLTDANVYVADKLFATLDPTVRRIELEDAGPLVVADTVGFIRHLPHRLVNAFRATLEEANSATLLLHVVDAAGEEREANVAEVEAVLTEIGASAVPRLEVYNKVDLLEQEPRIERDAAGLPIRVWLSAHTGAGCDLLLDALAEILAGDFVNRVLKTAPAQGRLRASLYQLGAVQEEIHSDDGYVQLRVRLARKDWQQLLATERLTEASLC